MRTSSHGGGSSCGGGNHGVRECGPQSGAHCPCCRRELGADKCDGCQVGLCVLEGCRNGGKGGRGPEHPTRISRLGTRKCAPCWKRVQEEDGCACRALNPGMFPSTTGADANGLSTKHVAELQALRLSRGGDPCKCPECLKTIEAQGRRACNRAVMVALHKATCACTECCCACEDAVGDDCDCPVCSRYQSA